MAPCYPRQPQSPRVRRSPAGRARAATFEWSTCPAAAADIVVSPVLIDPAGPASEINEELVTVIEDLSEEHWPGVPVIPSMSAGATDSRFLRAAGIPAYGHTGFARDVDDVRAHGQDERIGVEAFQTGVAYLYDLVKRLSSVVPTENLIRTVRVTDRADVGPANDGNVSIAAVHSVNVDEWLASFGRSSGRRAACTVFRRRPSMAVVRPRDDGSCGAGRPRAASQ